MERSVKIRVGGWVGGAGDDSSSLQPGPGVYNDARESRIRPSSPTACEGVYEEWQQAGNRRAGGGSGRGQGGGGAAAVAAAAARGRSKVHGSKRGRRAKTEGEKKNEGRRGGKAQEESCDGLGWSTSVGRLMALQDSVAVGRGELGVQKRRKYQERCTGSRRFCAT